MHKLLWALLAMMLTIGPASQQPTNAPALASQAAETDDELETLRAFLKWSESKKKVELAPRFSQCLEETQREARARLEIWEEAKALPGKLEVAGKEPSEQVLAILRDLQKRLKEREEGAYVGILNLREIRANKSMVEMMLSLYSGTLTRPQMEGTRKHLHEMEETLHADAVLHILKGMKEK